MFLLSHLPSETLLRVFSFCSSLFAIGCVNQRLANLWSYYLKSQSPRKINPDILKKPEFQLEAVQEEAFKRDGFVLLRGVIGEEWISELKSGLLSMNITKTGGTVNLSKTGPAIFRKYCFSSPLPAIAAQLLGSEEVFLYFDHMIIKEAGTPKDRTNWHNDQPYWPVWGKQVMSFWLPLDVVTKENGALEFIKGSHTWPNNWYHPQGISGDHYQYQDPLNDIPLVPDIEAHRKDYDIISYDMWPGDVLAFHALTLHGSCGNTTIDRNRRAYSVRYCGCDVTYFWRQGCLPFLKNGTLKNGDAIRDVGEMHPVVYRKI